jgi:GNAT superfamily N-acetyltransferase
MKYRKAEKGETGILAELRKKQLTDEGIAPDINIDGELARFFRDHMKDESMAEWVAEEDGRIVATAAVIFYDFPPSYSNKSGVKGYVTNMYTAPEYRGHGIAAALLDHIVEEAKLKNVKKLWLGASEMGRPVYLKYGFSETDDLLELDIG